MATYTKETALYDTGAISEGISDASETASNYLTDVTGGGVYVHSADTPSDPTAATAKGVKITDQIDIIRGGTSAASFGEDIRIGLADGSRIELDSYGMSAISSDNSPYFSVISSGSDIVQEWKSEYDTRTWTSTSATSVIFTISLSSLFGDTWSQISNGQEFKFEWRVYCVRKSDGGGSLQDYNTWTFVKGTNKTVSSSHGRVEFTNTGYTASTATIRIEMALTSNYKTDWRFSSFKFRGTTKFYTPAPFYKLGANVQESGKALGVAFGNGTSPSAYGVSLGKYNEQDALDKYAFIIGNGTADDARSNALTVDWNGKVECGDYNGNFKSIFDIFYPVGSYYETSDTTFDPNTAWGGTWEKDSAGKVTVAQDTNDTSFDTIGETGGSKYIQAHTHSFTQPTITSYYRNTVNYSSGSAARPYTSSGSSSSTDWAKASGGAVGAVSGATTGNAGNLQPYIVVIRWHRTA